MKISICLEDIEIKMDDLKEKTVNGLIDAIIETRKDEKPPRESIRIFYKSIKLTPGKTLEEEGITDESHLFTYIRKEFVKKPEQSTVKPNDFNSANVNNMNNNMAHNINMGGMNAPGVSPNMMNNFSGITPEMVNSVLNDPNMIETTINIMMPNASDAQKQMIRNQFELIKSNPELLNMASNYQNMMGNPYGNFYNPMMGMSNPMMNNMASNVTNLNGASNQPPKNGPCSHGFYPLDFIQDIDKKLDTLISMGFTDKERNRILLLKYGGSLEATIEELTKKE